jgi:hypothetical protein
VPTLQVDFLIGEVVEEHHFDEGFRYICPAVLEIDSGVLNAHAFVHATDRRFLSSNIDNAGIRSPTAKGGCQALLHEAHPLEVEFAQNDVQDLANKDALVQVWNDKHAAILHKILLSVQTQQRLHRFLQNR